MKHSKRIRRVIWGGVGLFIVGLYFIPNPYVREAIIQSGSVQASDGKTQFVSVEPNVSLEVIDFGGTGPPVLLLAGLGDTAHAFTPFAAELVPKYHVYAMTRRGFGRSSIPAKGYGTTRLGEDVVAVVDHLKLERPVLIGHSFAGAELSVVASHHGEKVRGLIYLDAGNAYALFDKNSRNLAMRISNVLRWVVPMLPPVFLNVRLLIFAGPEKFTEIPVPVLAIFADPHDLSSLFKGDPAAQAKAEELDRVQVDHQADAFSRQVPSAKVIKLPRASHYVHRSNQFEVLREIDRFMATIR
jgi:non-heme chloroperoxidase